MALAIAANATAQPSEVTNRPVGPALIFAPGEDGKPTDGKYSVVFTGLSEPIEITVVDDVGLFYMGSDLVNFCNRVRLNTKKVHREIDAMRLKDFQTIDDVQYIFSGVKKMIGDFVCKDLAYTRREKSSKRMNK